MTSTLLPVAQYLRMSTEHQQYSLEHQAAAIQKYAEEHNFEIVRTYSDAAKSGVVLKRRSGLRHLLQDVASGNAGYDAVLVYDVSRSILEHSKSLIKLGRSVSCRKCSCSGTRCGTFRSGRTSCKAQETLASACKHPSMPSETW